MIKLREAIRNLLIQELGDSTEGHRYKRLRSEIEGPHAFVEYEFENAAGYRYKVRIQTNTAVDIYNGENFASVDFSAYDRDTGLGMAIVNGNDVFKTMATIMNIVEDAAESWVPKVENATETKISMFAFVPMGRGSKDLQRAELYKRFIKNRLGAAPVENKNKYYVKYK